MKRFTKLLVTTDTRLNEHPVVDAAKSRDAGRGISGRPIEVNDNG